MRQAGAVTQLMIDHIADVIRPDLDLDQDSLFLF